jgi:protein-ribulosamine 3-kinase
MPRSNSIPPALLAALHRIEPHAQFFQSPASSSSQVQSSSTNKTYFAKLGSATSSDVEQYHGEAESLRAMYAASPGICPRVFESSVDPASNQPVFISEYKSIAPLNEESTLVLAAALAEMHTKGKSPTGQYGFAVPTYCGQTRMSNGWSHTWAGAYDKMMGDLLHTLKLTGQFDEICALGEEVRAR